MCFGRLLTSPRHAKSGSALGTKVFGIYRTPLGCYENLIRFDLSIHPSRSCENANIFSMHCHLLDPGGGVDTLA